MTDSKERSENPAISGDAEADRKRAEIDYIIETRYNETPKQKREYEDWYSQQTFKSPLDREVFDKLPLSNTEKMLLIQEMRQLNNLTADNEITAERVA